MFKRHSTATDLRLKIVPSPSQPQQSGLGTLIIPGWIRERGGEVLFEGGDVDESSVAETILDALLKVSVLTAHFRTELTPDRSQSISERASLRLCLSPVERRCSRDSSHAYTPNSYVLSMPPRLPPRVPRRVQAGPAHPRTHATRRSARSYLTSPSLTIPHHRLRQERAEVSTQARRLRSRLRRWRGSVALSPGTCSF